MRKERAIRLNDEKNICGDFFGGGGGEGLDHPVCRFQFLFYDLSRKLSRSKELLSPVK